jgi:hypothetical protein
LAEIGNALRGLFPDRVAVDDLDQRERALWLRRHRNTGRPHEFARRAARVRRRRCLPGRARRCAAVAYTTTPLASDEPGPGASGNR